AAEVDFPILAAFRLLVDIESAGQASPPVPDRCPWPVWHGRMVQVPTCIGRPGRSQPFLKQEKIKAREMRESHKNEPGSSQEVGGKTSLLRRILPRLAREAALSGAQCSDE